jgi:DNA-binding NtrC family response regulator
MTATQHASSNAVLVVDDDRHIRAGMRDILEHGGYAVLEASDGKTALHQIEQEPVDIVLLDLQLPRIGGMEVLHQVAADHPALPVVIISGKGTIQSAVEATKLGAYDFLEKPVDAQRALVTVRNALEKSRLQRQRDRLLDEARDRYRMVGSSAPMQRIYTLIDKAAATNSKVLITGENGTGKELVARAIHHNSDRAGEPFVTVNCAAIPESLIESELFGHEGGAFTGAEGPRKGTFEQADGGTLFLDEIGDMSLAAQAKTLRALQDGVIHRIGSEQTRAVDVRVIAATNKDLSAEIESGDFREDLYWRLNVVAIHVPPLRARRDDIPDLARHFLDLFSAENGFPPRELSSGALVALMNRDWPGNIRELRNLVERLVVLTDGATIDAPTIRQMTEGRPVLPGSEAAQDTDLRAARERFERMFIAQALRDNDGVITQTAEALGIDRSYLWKKMKQYDIEADA